MATLAELWWVWLLVVLLGFVLEIVIGYKAFLGKKSAIRSGLTSGSLFNNPTKTVGGMMDDSVNAMKYLVPVHVLTILALVLLVIATLYNVIH